MFVTLSAVRREDLDELWKIENLRRSLVMLPPGAPGLSRDDAMLILELLAEQMTESPTRDWIRGVMSPAVWKSL